MNMIWKKVKELEERQNHESWKLPKHNKNVYFVYKFPLISSKYHAGSLEHAVRILCSRFVKLFGMRVDVSNTRVYGVGTKNHHKRIVLKIYFKEMN